MPGIVAMILAAGVLGLVQARWWWCLVLAGAAAALSAVYLSPGLAPALPASMLLFGSGFVVLCVQVLAIYAVGRMVRAGNGVFAVAGVLLLGVSGWLILANAGPPPRLARPGSVQDFVYGVRYTMSWPLLIAVSRALDAPWIYDHAPERKEQGTK